MRQAHNNADVPIIQQKSENPAKLTCDLIDVICVDGLQVPVDLADEFRILYVRFVTFLVLFFHVEGIVVDEILPHGEDYQWQIVQLALGIVGHFLMAVGIPQPLFRVQISHPGATTWDIY